jgi:ribonuclease PH
MATPTISVVRSDGRELNQLRPISVRPAELTGADGSAACAMGRSRVLAAIVGPAAARPNAESYDGAVISVSLQRPDTAELSAVGGGASRLRAVAAAQTVARVDSEIVATVRRALNAVVFTSRFPRCGIAVTLTILGEDGSLLACCVNAAIAAALDAALACRETAAAVTLFALRPATGPAPVSAIVYGLDPNAVEEAAVREYASTPAATLTTASGWGDIVARDATTDEPVALVPCAAATYVMTASGTLAANVSLCGDAAGAVDTRALLRQLEAVAAAAIRPVFDALRVGVAGGIVAAE